MYKKIGMVPNVQISGSSLEFSRTFIHSQEYLVKIFAFNERKKSGKSDEKRHSLSSQSQRKESLLFMLVTYLYDDCTMTDFLY